jgi:NAD(P)-dependent dehydrogenase (short-subunit alcohol dehydrogenase family)
MIGAPSTVLVTGCSSGFGELTVKTLVQKGHRVFASMRAVHSRNAEPARRLRDWAASRNLRLDIVEMDVSDGQSVQACVDGILTGVERLDVVVNNAGVGAMGPIEAFSMAQIEMMMSTNALGPIRVDRAVLPSMRRHRSGLLIHVSSAVGRVLPGAGGAYAGTKWALEALAESLHDEVKPFGIDVAIVEPGAFPATQAMAHAINPENTALAAEYAKAGRAFRFMTLEEPPQDVADAIASLIEMPAGQRPLRTVVGRLMTEGLAEYNEVYQRIKARLIEGLYEPDQPVPSS